ncbi:undecaprenyl-diphosphate phosphatase [Branchiibius hedensis]|uniref:undecaprenyl-diphosphate phosphatase n=1 Tax=Branchiibius hedensis TaxID=672460 RepID=UPI001FE3D8B6|nr:undecaprenyl-diphosphate phosphatase [Branchiibius hedensis]
MTQQSARGHTPYLAFIVALHVATALALIVFYRKDWVAILAGVGDLARERRLTTPRSRLAWWLILGTIPVCLIGLALDKSLRVVFAKPLYAAIFLTLNGFLLLAAELLTRRARGRGLALRDLGWVNATIIGASQAIALLPGFSRSGATISTGLLRGLDHEKATRFAFLLATPVILAAGVLKIPELFGPEGQGIGGQILAGSIVAFVCAYLSTRFLTRYFHTRTLYPFVVYCLIAGGISILRFA